MSLEELSQIEVTTPSKSPTRAFRTPAAIYVITNEDIRRSGATSIPEVLRLAPGVEVARIDASKWSIGIRGFGTRFTRGVLVLIDGRTVYSTLLAGTYWEVQDTMLEDVDRIEVIRGPGGTIWGPNAVNGVINIITKSAGETRGVLVTAGGGNEEQGFASARYGGRTKGGLNWRVYGKGFTRGPEYHSDGRNFDDWRAAQTGFRTDWTNSHGDNFTVQGDAYGEAAGESVNAISYTPPFSQIRDENQGLSGLNILGRWQRKLKNGGDFQVQAYYDRTSRDEPNIAERRGTYDIDFIHHVGVHARQDFTWGLGARATRIRSIDVVSGLLFRPLQRVDSLYTGFIQDEIALVPQRLSLTLGTKILKTNFSDVDFEPSVRLAWTPSDATTLWSAFTHSVRTPSDAEENFILSGFVGVTSAGVPLFARFNPNPKFAPEQLNGYEAGYRRLLGKKLIFGISSFYNHYHNLFDEEITGGYVLEDTPAPQHYVFPAEFRNGLLGNTKGVEVAPEVRPSKIWRLRGSYSFLQMTLAKSPGSGDIGTIPGIVGASPQHQGWVQSSFDFKNGEFDLTFRRVGSLPAQLVPAYSTADAHFGWRFAPGFDLSVVGRNLLQPHHPETALDPGPIVLIRRSAYLKLTWSR